MSNIYESPKASLNMVVTDEKMLEIIRYWERMRIVYNLALLVVGLLCLSISGSFAVIPILGLAGGIIFYGICANVMYTFGCYLNLFSVAILGCKPRVWEILLYIGLSFSVLLTAFLGWASLYAFTQF